MVTALEIEDAEDFGETLRLVRRLAGLTQQDLGAVMGVSAGRIGKYERAINPPNFATAIKLMHACGWRLVAVPAADSDGT